MEVQHHLPGQVDLMDAAALDDQLMGKPIEQLLREVTEVFPDICPVHLNKMAMERYYIPELIIDSILQDLENGVSYPKNTVLGKRKRHMDPILEILAKSDEEFGESDVQRLNEYFTGPVWKAHISKIKNYPELCVDQLVSQVFRRAKKTFIKKVYDERGSPTLFQLYWILSEHDYREQAAALEHSRREWNPIEFDGICAESSFDGDLSSLSRELFAARRIAAFKGHEAFKERREIVNRDKAVADGALRDCGCCFSDEPVNRMVSCDVDTEHLFCYTCVRRHAESQLGLMKYELKCLSMDDCFGHFPPSERKYYLDSKTIAALDRLEQDAVLREANIEGLASCPFCPYAAECPPIPEDKEFRCQNPNCMVVSCRLCSKETHIPKTCAEFAAENMASARHEIEEAMSIAMIRKCNKCSTPFVKLSGCNKMTCTKPGCRNQQCYICGASCDYKHFTKAGCKLHDLDSVEALHHEEAKTAQETVRKRLLEENPDMTEEDLMIKVPDHPPTAKIARYEEPLYLAEMDEGIQALLGRVIPGAHRLDPNQRNGHVQLTARQRPQHFQLRQNIANHPPMVEDQARQEQNAPLFQFGREQELQGVLRHAVQAPQPPGLGIRAHEQRQQLLQQLLRGYNAAAPEDRDGLLARVRYLSAVNMPEAVAPGLPRANRANRYNMPNGGDVPQPGPLRTGSRYNDEVRLPMLNSLKPYVTEITKQVANHIQAAWVGLMPQTLVIRLQQPIRRGIWNGVHELVEGELEEIDRTVRDIPWERLYGGHGVVAPGQIQHHGAIPAPETAGEYISLHEIIRSCDRNAPPHHQELARQAHAQVIADLGRQQPPPRVAPFHLYGHPDGGQPRGVAGPGFRIQMYLMSRENRVINDRAQGIVRQAMTNNKRGGPANETAGKGNSNARATAEAKVVLQHNAPGRPPHTPSEVTPGTTFQALPQTVATRTQPAGSAASNRPGSKDAPIVLDDDLDFDHDVWAGNRDSTPSRAGKTLPLRGLGDTQWQD